MGLSIEKVIGIYNGIPCKKKFGGFIQQALQMDSKLRANGITWLDIKAVYEQDKGILYSLVVEAKKCVSLLQTHTFQGSSGV